MENQKLLCQFEMDSVPNVGDKIGIGKTNYIVTSVSFIQNNNRCTNMVNVISLNEVAEIMETPKFSRIATLIRLGLI